MFSVRRCLQLCTAFLTFCSSTGWTCTAFEFQSQGGNSFVAKNFDYDSGHGLVVVNGRNIKKRALNLNKGDKGIHWKSRYGSITFNQAGLEFPYGGMNEAGLVVEILWDQSEEPGPRLPRVHDNTINESQWIQYQLDVSASVEDVLIHARDVEVSRVYAPVHYFVCDATGACAVVELVKGMARSIAHDDLPYKALANNRYADDLAVALDPHWSPPPYKKGDKLEDIVSSQLRFRGALAFSLGRPPEKEALDYGFLGLKQLEAPDYTKWFIIYDLQRKQVFFMSAQSPLRKKLDLTTMDFSCLKTGTGVSINRKREGDVSSLLRRLGPWDNWGLMRKTAGVSFLTALLGSFYPFVETFCTDVP